LAIGIFGSGAVMINGAPIINGIAAPIGLLVDVEDASGSPFCAGVLAGSLVGVEDASDSPFCAGVLAGSLVGAEDASGLLACVGVASSLVGVEDVGGSLAGVGPASLAGSSVCFFKQAGQAYLNRTCSQTNNDAGT
jgi:hypothetical protein